MPWRLIPGTAKARPVAVILKGLRPNATYHYRLIAINAAGASRGRDRTFRTGRP
jgi:phosphodiesterase/alkaline phosphatase D-like protein